MQPSAHGLPFIVYDKWKHTERLWRDKRIKKKWHVYVVQHDSARNKKEIIQFSGTQTKLRMTKLSKSQNEKEKKESYHL